jgi:hypothetical protein
MAARYTKQRFSLWILNNIIFGGRVCLDVFDWRNSRFGSALPERMRVLTAVLRNPHRDAAAPHRDAASNVNRAAATFLWAPSETK